jgi:hypothetical protein
MTYLALTALLVSPVSRTRASAASVATIDPTVR